MQNKTNQKIISAILLLLFLFALPLTGNASPPEIKDPLDKNLYQGKHETISSHIVQRREQIEKIIKTLDKVARESNDKDQRIRASRIRDLYLGLSLQCKLLLSELTRNNTAPVRPKVSGPPFTVNDFDLIIDYQRRVNSLLTDTNKQIISLQSRLGTLKTSAVDRLSDYSELLKTHPDRELDLYEKYCKLLNLQNEYAILRLRQPRLETLIEALTAEQKFAADWVSKAFTNLKVTPEDVSRAETGKKQAEKEYNRTAQQNNNLYQDLSRQILVYEARLNRLLDKIKKAHQEQQPIDNLWLIDKERFDLAINALQFKIRQTEQQTTNSYIKFRRTTFRCQWLTHHNHKTNTKQLSQFIAKWENSTSKIDQQLEEITSAISSVSLSRTNLTQRQVSINNRLANARNPKAKKALTALSHQAGKTVAELDHLALLLTNNDHELKNILREIEQILNLTRYSISSRARFQLWSETNFNRFKDRALQVLYYPIFSIGTSSIDLYIILKIIFLFFLGLGILRYIRRKIEHLLAKRAGLSPGAINSITTLGYYASILICTLIILQTAGLDLSQLGIIVGALGVGIGFGLQTITNNFISGIILLTEQSVKVGDYITLEDGVVGEVRKMTIRSTVIRTADSEDIIVPNSDLISNQVRSWSYNDDDWRRLDIPFGVSYDTDPDEVVRLAEEAAREVSLTREDYKHKLSVFFEGFGDNSLDFSLRVWCRMINLKAPAGLKTDYYFALFRKFREAGIEIPYPQRDLHLQSLSPELKEELKELFRESREKMSAASEPGRKPSDRPDPAEKS